MQRYTIAHAADAPPLAGEIASLPWSQAQVARIDEFTWYEGGDKQATSARLMYDENAIYVLFVCEDRHISAERRELNGPVCEDSCVEFFATVDPSLGPDYLNLEINCCGAFMLGFGPSRHDRRLISPAATDGIEIATSIPGQDKDSSPDDDGWWAAARLPFDVLSDFTGRPISPAAGELWRGNFYRCGGEIDAQYASWCPMGPGEPDYHRPEFFGELHFV